MKKSINDTSVSRSRRQLLKFLFRCQEMEKKKRKLEKGGRKIVAVQLISSLFNVIISSQMIRKIKTIEMPWDQTIAIQLYKTAPQLVIFNGASLTFKYLL